MTNSDPIDGVIAQWRRERPDLDAGSVGVFGRIYRIARQMGDRIEQAYAEFGISRGEFDVLATLRRAGEPFELSPRELATSTVLTTGGMTSRLDKLERAGWVRRSPDPHDRRGLRVTLTPVGLDVVDRALTAGLRVQRQLLADLAPGETETLTELLRTLLAATSRR